MANDVKTEEARPDPFDEKLDRIERRAKHLLAAVGSLAAALVATALVILAGWAQIRDTQRAMHADVEQVEKAVVETKDKTTENAQRLDAIGAPDQVGGTP